ncbi:MAG: GDSL-type esterase/lipase family protein [Lachnospiraceae bacterium]|nr:GDSL-type esterase/lipase family protein [Lachnospiraceae bacterium]
MKTILCFGDSNTYGLIPGTEDRYDENTRWTGILNENLYSKGYRIIEEGLCGRTTIFDDRSRLGRNGSKIFSILLESHKPLERVIIMLGTNDCKSYYNASAEEIGAGLEQLICQVRDSSPDIKILIISPIFLGEEVWKKEFDPEFNQKSVETSKKLKYVYEEIASRYGCSFLAASDVAKPSSRDQEHMDAKDHKKLAEAVLESITKEEIESLDEKWKEIA